MINLTLKPNIVELSDQVNFQETLKHLSNKLIDFNKIFQPRLSNPRTMPNCEFTRGVLGHAPQKILNS